MSSRARHSAASTESSTSGKYRLRSARRPYGTRGARLSLIAFLAIRSRPGLALARDILVALSSLPLGAPSLCALRAQIARNGLYGVAREQARSATCNTSPSGPLLKSRLTAAFRDQRGSPYEAHHPDSPLQAGESALATIHGGSTADRAHRIARSAERFPFEPLWSLIKKPPHGGFSGPEGLEPPTCCLEGSCSILLSYDPW